MQRLPQSLVAVPELPPNYVEQPDRIASLRDMLLADPFLNVGNYPISLGARAQDTALPAYTYEVRTVERADI